MSRGLRVGEPRLRQACRPGRTPLAFCQAALHAPQINAISRQRYGSPVPSKSTFAHATNPGLPETSGAVAVEALGLPATGHTLVACLQV